MKRKDYLGISILTAGIGAGYWIGDFYGGVIAGSCTCCLILVLIGHKLVKKATRETEDNYRRRVELFFENFRSDKTNDGTN